MLSRGAASLLRCVEGATLRFGARGPVASTSTAVASTSEAPSLLERFFSAEVDRQRTKGRPVDGKRGGRGGNDRPRERNQGQGGDRQSFTGKGPEGEPRGGFNARAGNKGGPSLGSRFGDSASAPPRARQELTAAEFLKRLYEGDPEILQLGRNNGGVLVNLLMRVPATEVPNAPAKPELPDLRGNETWVVEEDAKGDAVVKKEVTRKVDEQGRAFGAGTRKTARAQVWVSPAPDNDSLDRRGCPDVTVNGLPFDEYFKDMAQRKAFLYPLLMTDSSLTWTIEAHVQGGGYMGQAQAGKLALARAIQDYAPHLRPALLAGECLTVDPRKKERKKPGLTRARRGRQWSKR